MPLSFGSGAALVDRLEALPGSGTPWKAKNVIPESGTPLEPCTLFYRDPMDAIESLLQSPTFKDILEFVPHKVWSNPEDQNDLNDVSVTTRRSLVANGPGGHR
jgi:hypothetical protein